MRMLVLNFKCIVLRAGFDVRKVTHHCNVQFQKISKPPPPPTEGQWKFRGGGGLKGGNFRGVGGCAYEEFLQRVRKFTQIVSKAQSCHSTLRKNL